MNRSLSAAKVAKQDEFYTQYSDIQKEIEAYLEFDPDTFRGKIVYCNCDDPFESNFFKYFAANFNKLDLKKLITTSYDGSPIAGQLTMFPEYNEGNGKRQKPKALAVIVDHVSDEDGDGATNVTDVELFLKRNKAARMSLKGDEGRYPGGDFRSSECVAFLKEADIVVTNPPFSLFREYVSQLVEHGKRFLIIGNQNAISYKEVFKFIKETKMWLGYKSGDMAFRVPDYYEARETRYWKDDNGQKWRSMGNACWFTNLDHGRRHQKLECMTMAENLKFSRNLRGKPAYDRYANYEAIEIPTYREIPSDYEGMMGVPVTFLDKHNPEQFEILGRSENEDLYGLKTRVYTTKECQEAYRRLFGKKGTYDMNATPVIDGRKVYQRIFIRHLRPTKGKKK
ncbi:MAG: adenine-specific methyltransferase EcoRI family protein [Bacteroidota bacterium]